MDQPSAVVRVPLQGMTVSQVKFAQEHRERQARIAARGRPEVPIICLSASAKILAEMPIIIPAEKPPEARIVSTIIVAVPDEPGVASDASLPRPAAPLTVRLIQQICAAYFQRQVADLLSTCRRAQFVRVRQIAMFLCKEFTHRSLPDLGRKFGGRDHTTVLHAVRKITKLEKQDKEVADTLDTLRRQIRERC